MYRKFHLLHLLRSTVVIPALFALTACDQSATEIAETVPAPAVLSKVSGGAGSASVSGEIRLTIGQSIVMTTKSNNSRTRVVRWSSDNNSVASITSSGLLRGVAVGDAVITVTGQGVNERYAVNVAPAYDPEVVALVQVAAPTTTPLVGATVQMAAIAQTVSGSVVAGRQTTWRVSSGTAVSVSSTGLVTALAHGTAVVQATVDGVSGYLSLTPPAVVAPQVVTSVAVTSATTSLLVGGTVQMTASPTDMVGAAVTGRLVTWRVYSGSAVAISASGLVTAVAGGTAMVQATVDGVSGFQTITVNTVASPFVTWFTMSPTTGAALAPGATRQFTTANQWSDHVARAVTVTYTATGGTISSNGLFTAGQLAGTFMVFANCACGGTPFVDTAYVAVSVPVAQLSTLTISPKSVSLAASATQQFTVTASWSTGATTPPPVTYTTNGGYVSTGGLYTAPTTAGSYQVIVAHTGGTKKDTATVVVQSGTPAPPPGNGGTGSLFFTDNFDSGSRTNANGFAWGSGTSVTVSSEKSYSGNYALRFNYAAAALGSDSFSEQRFDMGRYVSDVSIEYMLFVPSNFKHRNDSPNNNKFIMLWRDTYSDAAGGTWRIGWEYTRGDENTAFGRFMSSRWDVNMWTDWGSWASPAPNLYPKLISSTGPVVIGQWNKIKFRAKAASSRTSENGIVELWVNDQLVMSHNAGRFHNAYALPADAVLRNGYFLGWANSGFTENTVFYIDDVKFTQGN